MLSIDHLRKTYKNFTLDCSLTVPAGRITGLIGQNGAGKSTSFKAILGLITPDSGEIRVFGKTPDEITVSDKQKLGVVLSDSGFSGYLTINDILRILGSMYDTFDRDFFLQKVQNFQLPQNKKIKEFSTGMKAKLKLLTAVSHDARLLILDEPTAGLDVIARDEVLELLREFMEKDETRSILISSHISSDLETLCDDLYMIDNGTIILHEDTDILLSNYAILKTEEAQFDRLDRQYLLHCRKENYGYSCLTAEKQYYMENYPDIVVEKGTIDDVISMMIRGEKL